MKKVIKCCYLGSLKHNKSINRTLQQDVDFMMRVFIKLQSRLSQTLFGFKGKNEINIQKIGKTALTVDVGVFQPEIVHATVPLLHLQNLPV